MHPTQSLLKHVKKLHLKKYRDEYREFVVENPLIVRDGIEKDAIPRSVIITRKFRDTQKELTELLQQKMSSEAFEFDEGELNALSSLEHPQGIVAVYDKLEEVIDDSLPLVFLNGVSDPSNVGAIIRSAAAFGVATVITDQESADPYNAKSISAAKESIFLLNIARKQESFLSELGTRVPLYALDAHEGAPLGTFSWGAPFCLVIGSEAHGLSSAAKEVVTAKLTIPLDQGKVESLNVGAAAAIALQAAFSAQQGGPAPEAMPSPTCRRPMTN